MFRGCRVVSSFLVFSGWLCLNMLLYVCVVVVLLFIVVCLLGLIWTVLVCFYYSPPDVYCHSVGFVLCSLLSCLCLCLCVCFVCSCVVGGGIMLQTHFVFGVCPGTYVLLFVLFLCVVSLCVILVCVLLLCVCVGILELIDRLPHLLPTSLISSLGGLDVLICCDVH